MATGEPWTSDDYLAHFEAFLVKHPELSPSRFGLASTGDTGLIANFRKGVNVPNLKRLQRVCEWMKTYKKPEAFRALPPAAKARTSIDELIS